MFFGNDRFMSYWTNQTISTILPHRSSVRNIIGQRFAPMMIVLHLQHNKNASAYMSYLLCRKKNTLLSITIMKNTIIFRSLLYRITEGAGMRS